MDKINTPFKATLAIVAVLLLVMIISKVIWKQSLQYYDYIFIVAGIVAVLGTWFKTKK